MEASAQPVGQQSYGVHSSHEDPIITEERTGPLKRSSFQVMLIQESDTRCDPWHRCPEETWAGSLRCSSDQCSNLLSDGRNSFCLNLTGSPLFHKMRVSALFGGSEGVQRDWEPLSHKMQFESQCTEGHWSLFSLATVSDPWLGPVQFLVDQL